MIIWKCPITGDLFLEQARGLLSRSHPSGRTPYLGYVVCSWRAHGCVFWQSRRRRRSKGRSGVCWGERRTCGRCTTWPGKGGGDRGRNNREHGVISDVRVQNVLLERRLDEHQRTGLSNYWDNIENTNSDTLTAKGQLASRSESDHNYASISLH